MPGSIKNYSCGSRSLIQKYGTEKEICRRQRGKRKGDNGEKRKNGESRKLVLYRCSNFCLFRETLSGGSK